MFSLFARIRGPRLRVWRLTCPSRRTLNFNVCAPTHVGFAMLPITPMRDAGTPFTRPRQLMNRADLVISGCRPHSLLRAAKEIQYCASRLHQSVVSTTRRFAACRTTSRGRRHPAASRFILRKSAWKRGSSRSGSRKGYVLIGSIMRSGASTDRSSHKKASSIFPSPR